MLPTRSLLATIVMERPHYYWMAGKEFAFHSASLDSLLLLGSDENLDSPLDLFSCHPNEGNCYSWARVKIWVSHLTFAYGSRGELVFFMVLAGGRVVTCLKVFWLTKLLHSCFFGQKEKTFLGIFSYLLPLAFLSFCLLQHLV